MVVAIPGYTACRDFSMRLAILECWRQVIVDQTGGFNVFLLMKGNRKSEKDELSVSNQDCEIEKNERRLYCSSCRFPITFMEARSEINGKSSYTFFNPHGLVFDIQCFATADGCSVRGRPVDEFSWFPGYRWQVCICGRCHKHLGWFFSGLSTGFFGLIMRELSR